MSKKISRCVHGGGSSCRQQGGSGVASHARAYVHPYPTTLEVGLPVGDYVEPVQKAIRSVRLDKIQELFDEDNARYALDTYVHSGANIVRTVRKSLYNFDLETNEGVHKLLELLPVLDVAILQEVAGEIWPGYPAQETDPDLLRGEVLGYLLDWQDGHGQQEG